MYLNVTHTLSFAKEASNEGDLEALAQKEVEEAIQTPWRLILYNDEVHTFEEVTQQLSRH
jgi:ATP-dependent Clp protease adaptor protein ClpS